MKKLGAFAILFLAFLLVPLVISAEGDNCTTSSDCGSGEVCEEGLCEEETYTDTNTEAQQDTSKVEDAFECLEDKAKDCSTLSVEEIALTILATPDNIFEDCVDELKSREKANHWGNIKDTALAIMALNHAGEDTEPSEEWLIAQNQTPTELIWYMQEDSNEETECHIGYNGKDYSVIVGENKKIDSNAGSCLTRAQVNYWLQISPDCFDQDFNVECDKDFIANLIYKNKQSSTIYVLDGTESSPAFGSITLNVKSRCFGSSSCDYESTAWATLALLKTGHNIKDFIPYIIAMSDTNERYLPEAFIYMLTSDDDYATKLIESQKLGNYWEAKSSANNKYYDTALALISLRSSSSEQITKARDWLLFSQGSNGCWQNAVKETAIILWALEGRAGRSSSGGGVTYCSQAGYFCIPSSDCPSSEDVGNNYFCSSLSDTCCINENLKTCSEYSGQVCASDKICVGNSRKATDALDGDCCTGTCQDRPTETECEQNFYACMDQCSEYQEPVSTYACNGAQVCCRTKTEESSSGWPWWIWLLIILILITLGALGYIYREKLKLYWFQLKTKFKKDKGEGGASSSSRPRPGFPPRPSFPPKPGFPPIRRPQPPVAQMSKRTYDRRDPEMSETFRKLREMSG
jgi:hypothetical protein